MLSTSFLHQHTCFKPITHKSSSSRSRGSGCRNVKRYGVTCTSSPRHHLQEDNCKTTESSSRRQALLSALTLAATTTASALPATALPGFKKDLSNKRRQTIPEEAYSDGPMGLKFYDISLGDGPLAKEGSRVVVHFDAKWRGITFVTSRQGIGVTGGSPQGFDVGAKVGQGGTLKGLDRCTIGMRVGGQRRCLVPPELAYGSKGYGEIPPNATITLDVQLLSVKTSPTGFKVKVVEG